MTAIANEVTPSRRIAAEVRAEMARQGVSSRQLALRMGGVSYMWISRRIGLNSDVELSFEDVYKLADALGINALKILEDAGIVKLPRLDSNQQPSGYRASRRTRPANRPDEISRPPKNRAA